MKTLVYRFSGKSKQLVEEQDIISKMNKLTSGDIQKLKFCEDCQRDKDSCPDCFEGNLYKSPDQPDYREER